MHFPNLAGAHFAKGKLVILIIIINFKFMFIFNKTNFFFYKIQIALI